MIHVQCVCCVDELAAVCDVQEARSAYTEIPMIKYTYILWGHLKYVQVAIDVFEFTMNLIGSVIDVLNAVLAEILEALGFGKPVAELAEWDTLPYCTDDTYDNGGVCIRSEPRSEYKYRNFVSLHRIATACQHQFSQFVNCCADLSRAVLALLVRNDPSNERSQSHES